MGNRFVSSEDFKGQASIPALVNWAGQEEPANRVVRTSVEQLIDRVQYKWLEMALCTLGDTAAIIGALYRANDGELDSEHLRCAIALLKRPLADFVSFQYHRTASVADTSIGGISLEGENGTRTDTVELQVSLWNDMVETLKDRFDTIKDEIREGTAEIGVLVNEAAQMPSTDVYRTINTFGF